MTMNKTANSMPLWRRLRWVVWGGLAMLLALPLVAMQFTPEVQWTLSDFIVMGSLLGCVGAAFEVVVRVARNSTYVIAAGIAAMNALLMTWINLAVGIIGNEGNPANLMFFGVLAVGLVAVACSRLRPQGMALAMAITAAAQAVVCVVAIAIVGSNIFFISSFFVAMRLVSAWLFRRAARVEATSGGVLQAA